MAVSAAMMYGSGGASEGAEMGAEAGDEAKPKKPSSDPEKKEEKDPNMQLIEDLKEIVSFSSDMAISAMMGDTPGGGASIPKEDGASFDAMAQDHNSKQDNASDFKAPAALPDMDEAASMGASMGPQ